MSCSILVANWTSGSKLWLYENMHGRQLSIQAIGTIKHHCIDSSLDYKPSVGRSKIQQGLDKAHSCASALIGLRLLRLLGNREQRHTRWDLVDGPEPLYLSYVLEGAS